ncbi:Pentatricopeptide repeat-containing protein [Camellia lanceoleosa]|uniref:Pentatricopeptide repeat-containing protein n=1 Tax=Camellia lanceoleosa TaxID=1840588 RepID=A0ACC0FFW4_9ERIC|nr:Pentatricopeptide repeat-containing protein [Camellia lanceoleosa]
MTSLFFHTRSNFLSQAFFLLLTSKNPNPSYQKPSHCYRFFSNQSSLSVTGKSLIRPKPDPNFDCNDFTTICDLLTNPSSLPGPTLEAALDRTGIELGPPLLQQIFDRFGSSPKLMLSLFLWSERRPGYRSSVDIFNAMIKVFARAREFESAWCLILNRLKRPIEGPNMDTFAILIRRYARAGMPSPAIRTLEFACSLDLICKSNSKLDLFEILLDSFCKEGLVWEASAYIERKRGIDPYWASQFIVVTYGILVQMYCQMCRVEEAVELLDEMKREGIEPDAIVYNPIIDALGEAGRFKEALGMMERFLVLESGPTVSSYNSLVNGFCKAGDLEGANKILKMMISRGFMPTTTTYNYFFRYFSKLGKIEEGLNLYTKMMEYGYTPDRSLTISWLSCCASRRDWTWQCKLERKWKLGDMIWTRCMHHVGPFAMQDA